MEDEFERMRKRIEELERETQPLKLKPYLEEFHAINLLVQYIHTRTLTTQGSTTDPTNRIYPQRIVPWDTFPEEQGTIWDTLLASPSFSDNAIFPARVELRYVKDRLDDVTSEVSLRNSQVFVVEQPIKDLMRRAYNDEETRCALGIDGQVIFQDHTNIGRAADSITAGVDELSIDDTNPQTPQPQRRARGKGNRADQWCIYRTADGRDVPTVAIEYKAPHKLNRHEIARGLNTGPYPDIQPDRDIINQQAKPGEEFDFDAKWLVTAVITQLFSYMVGKGMQYGYICTGEVFIFLHIPDDDPSMVYYFTSVPSMDRDDERSNSQDGIYRTAVAHVFAFVLQAIQSPPPPQSWHTKANRLPTWQVEYEDVLRDIPSTVRTSPDHTPYRPLPWNRPSRKTPTSLDNPGADSHDSPSPSQRRANRRNPPRDGSAKSGGKQLQHDQSGSQSNSRGSGQGNSSVRQRIQDRPYCTHTCLHGVAFGGPMDRECPNFADHGNTHIDQGEFRRVMRQQLAVDRDKDADCMPLFLVGSRGSLFKLRLSSYGYTLVAKGVEAMDAEQLRHESSMYDHVEGLQGQYVPVCLGTINLIEPHYFDGGVYTHFMLMSYGGRSILSEIKSVDSSMADQVIAALNRLHQHGLLHRDAEPRNVLYDRSTGRCMLVDLMLAEIFVPPQPARQPLGSMSPNVLTQRPRVVKRGRDMFALEQQRLRVLLS